MDTLLFELVVVRYVEFAVTGAGGNHDGVGPDRLPIVERQPVWPLAAVDPGHMARDREARAELLRLYLGAAGQRLAGNAGREPEVVLDLRAGAGLRKSARPTRTTRLSTAALPETGIIRSLN